MIDLGSQNGSLNGNFQKGLNVIYEEDQSTGLRDPQPKTLLQVRSRGVTNSRLQKLGRSTATGAAA